MTVFKPFFTASLLLALAFAPGPVFAADEHLEEIFVTARRGADNRSETVSAVSVVDEGTLSAQQATIVTDALQAAPGVFIQQTTPGQGTAIVRGLKGSEILHLVDGMRLNNALFRNAPNQYLALVDPWIVERSEIVRGPLSSLYGSDAMGGVVHLLTGRPEFSGDTATLKMATRLAYDSATLGQSINVSVAGGTARRSAGLTFSHRSLDDVRAAGRRVQTPTAYRSRAASAFLSLTDSRERVWDLSAQYLEQPETPRFDELVPGFGQTEPASEQFFFAPNSRLFVHARHRASGLSPWFDQLELNLGWQQVRDDRRTQDTGSTRVRTEQNRSDLFGLTLQATTADIGAHSLSYGVDVYYDEVSSARTQLDLDTGVSEAIRSRFPDGSTLTNIDAFVHDRIDLNERLAADAGLRLSRARVKLTATENADATSISNVDASGSVGLRYRANDAVDVVLNLARGFRAPNIFDLGTLGARPGNRFNIANTNLGPETVLTGDLGLRFNGERGSVEAVMWASDYQDKIVSVFTGEIDDNGRDVVQSQIASSVSLRGVELSAQWRPGDRHRFDASLNYTRADTTIDDDKEPADRIPPLNGRFAWRYERDTWSGGLQWSFAAAQDRLSARDVRDPRINPLGTPGWGAVDVLFGYRPTDQWALSVRLANLLDADYRRHGSGLDAEGRNVKISIDGKF